MLNRRYKKMSIDYQRQQSLRIPQYHISVIGAGGTGSWVALLSALSGSRQIKLFDSDSIVLHNLNRLPLPPSSVGGLKTQAIKELIQHLRPDCSILCFGNIQKDSLSLLEGVVYDCTDRREIQDILQEYCLSKEPPLLYRRVGYDGNHLTVISKGVPVDPQPTTQDGYQIVPSWVVPSVLSACLGVYTVLRENNILSFVGDIPKIYNLEDPPEEDDNESEDVVRS